MATTAPGQPDGFAVVPTSTPYRQNAVNSTPKTYRWMFKDSVQPLRKTCRTADTRSVVKLQFATVSGQAILIWLRDIVATAVQFPDVFDEDGASVNIVDEASKAFVRVARAQGR